MTGVSLSEQEYTDERGGVWHRGTCSCGWAGPDRGTTKRCGYDAFDHLIDAHPGAWPWDVKR